MSAQASSRASGHDLARRLWSGRAPVLSLLLLPAEALFRLTQAAYHGAYDRGLLPRTGAAVPAISVGNLAVGGAGKTPVARWLVERLLERGEHPALLHGGYGADEPALHARWHPGVPVYADRDRASAARRAVAAGATVLVLDDAFQHRRLRRDLDIVLVAAERWSGRLRLLPRGPWREPPGALRRAQLVAVTRKVADAGRAAEVARELARYAPGRTVVRFALLPAGWRPWSAPTGAGDPPNRGEGRRPPDAAGAGTEPEGVVVCAIADPELFLENVRATGARIDAALVFRDHHAFTSADVARIRRACGTGVVLTTAKNAVRLSAAAPDLPLRVLDQVVRMEAGEDALRRALDTALRRG